MRRKADELLREWRDRADRKTCWSKACASVARPICSERTPRIFSNRLSTLILRTTGRRERIFRAVLTLIRLYARSRLVRDSVSCLAKPYCSLMRSRHARKRSLPLNTFAKMLPSITLRLLGRFLGVAINHQSYSFPVGKTDLIEMTPLDFEEFLWAWARSAGRRDTLIIRVNESSCAKPS